MVLVEDRASGQSLLQELQRDTAIPLRAIKVDRDKLSRAHAVTGLLEAGRVFLPESAPWLADFLDEVSAFPYGSHDDQVDSMTQALNYLRHNSHGVLLYYQKELAEKEQKNRCANPNCTTGPDGTRAVIGDRYTQARGLKFCSAFCAL